MQDNQKLIAILGPTASGKTRLAVALAREMNGEILSADSRQVYRQMDIGTGKDLDDYTRGGAPIAYHLIDILNPGEKYNLHAYQKDFHTAYQEIIKCGKTPILCGGSGLYAEAILRNYNLIEVPPNSTLRSKLQKLTDAELHALLKQHTTPHNTTDLDSRQRTIRAIEIAIYTQQKKTAVTNRPTIQSHANFALDLPREIRRLRITQRLNERLQQGLIEEVKNLMQRGVPEETLIYYGLEYRFVTQHLTGELSYQQMHEALNTAIHQFAKRQMTYLRGLERRGVPLIWLDATLPTGENVARILAHLKEVELGQA